MSEPVALTVGVSAVRLDECLYSCPVSSVNVFIDWIDDRNPRVIQGQVMKGNVKIGLRMTFPPLAKALAVRVRR